MTFYRLTKQFLAVVVISAALPTSVVGKEKAPLSLTWRMEKKQGTSKWNRYTFVLHNTSRKTLRDNWTIYYTQEPRRVEKMETRSVTIEHISGTYFRLRPTAAFGELQPGDSIVASYIEGGRVSNCSKVPEGAYVVLNSGNEKSKPLPVRLNVVVRQPEAEVQNRRARQVYEWNRQIGELPVLADADILPSVKRAVPAADGSRIEFPKTIAIRCDKNLKTEAQMLAVQLIRRHGITFDSKAPLVIRLQLVKKLEHLQSAEAYSMRIDRNEICISATTPHGVFNATQTLLAMLKGQSGRLSIACQTIDDEPDLPYRGVMLDVARNFTSVVGVKRLIDLMAGYKLTALHLHLTDDEGWRIEIPGLKELTTVGAHRGHTADESKCLYPAYDGGSSPTASTPGNGFFSREDFIDLLRYAAARHIRIIPEIEAPGHARAAIVAMKARYNKYKSSNRAKAEEYLLTNPADTSRYRSAQGYTDNVVDVSMPSVYTFMEKVLAELKSMYHDARLALTEVHLGGDEVPRGAWAASPGCVALMKQKGMTMQHELFEHFYCEMANRMQRMGIAMSGWQEIALHHSDSTFNHLRTKTGAAYCWDTVAEWGNDTIPYSVANNGFDVVLCNVNNFYLDLYYTPHFDERGQAWAGSVDESKGFSALPYNIYRSARVNLKNQPVDIDSLEAGKQQLRNDCRQHIRGVQGQLFSEMIRNFDDVEYYVFPKLLGLAERGWNAHPRWEHLRQATEKQEYARDLTRFYGIISKKEMPFLENENVNFRLATPGMTIKNGMLHINSPIFGAQIRYTLDGTTPTSASPLYIAPVPCTASIIKARLFYLGKESVTTTLQQ